MSRSIERGKPKETEAQIQRAILEYLKLKGVFCWRQNSGAFRLHGAGGDRFVRAGFPGISDILGILRLAVQLDGPTQRWYNGRFLAIEVKRPGQKPTPDQQAFLAAVKANGGVAFIATSVEDVRKELGL